jgi:hypothetical protein
MQVYNPRIRVESLLVSPISRVRSPHQLVLITPPDLQAGASYTHL